MSRVARMAIALALLLVNGGCRHVLEYTDELVSLESGRSWVVRAPANLGGAVGFVAGLPVDLLALPATGTFYVVEDARTDGNADLLSIVLFPSVVLWKIGALIGAPFDALEYVAWRSWHEPAALSDAERERAELRWDEEALPRYPVAPVFPLPTDPVGG